MNNSCSWQPFRFTLLSWAYPAPHQAAPGASAWLREYLSKRELETGRDIAAIQDIGFRQDDDIGLLPIRGYRTPARVDGEHHLRTGFQPIKDLLLNLYVAVVRRDHLDSQIRRSGPVPFNLADCLDAPATDERHIWRARTVSGSVVSLKPVSAAYTVPRS